MRRFKKDVDPWVYVDIVAT